MMDLTPAPTSRSQANAAVDRRRVLMQLGTWGGMGVAGWNIPRQGWGLEQVGSSFGRAKRCIFLFMWGGPSQLDTFDLKPHAPSDIRGEFRPISTRVPGLLLCEHFERLAEWTDRVTIVRSLHHDDPAHLSSAHTTLTGHLPPVNRSDAEPPSDKDTPHLGSVLSHIRPMVASVPSFVMLPWRVMHPAAPGGEAPGQHGGWLGQQHNPFLVSGDPSQPHWRSPALTLLDDVSLERLHDRRSLLGALDQTRATIDSAAVRQATHWEQRAFELLSSGQVRQAFDLQRESSATRDRYGRNIHGQCVLLARRLIEHDVPIVTVNWHNDGKNFWDTHGDNFRRLKHDLIPVADQALSALLSDLEERQLLDSTLVVWVGEFGRRPKITPGNAGREHWPACYSGLLAGGGIRAGYVHGESDPHGAYPVADGVTPHEMMATIYHALGIPSQTVLYDELQRPRPVYAAEPIRSLLI